MILKFKKLRPESLAPTRQNAGDAGLDLYAARPTVIPYRGRAVIPTGIAVEIPEGHAGIVMGRSGNTSRLGLLTASGLVDSGYRGEVGVMVFNCSETEIEVAEGAKVGQLVVMPVPSVALVEVERLSDSERGTRGFGSSGTV